MQRAVLEAEGDQAEATALAVDDEVEREILDKELGAAPHP
jgi:hypothetical protein